jgi:hypothetical protein
MVIKNLELVHFLQIIWDCHKIIKKNMEKNHDYREKENFGLVFFLALDMGTSSSSNYRLKIIHSQWALITASIEIIKKKEA